MYNVPMQCGVCYRCRMRHQTLKTASVLLLVLVILAADDASAASRRRRGKHAAGIDV